MPRFVILEHDWPTRHWDLLLEAGEVLKAWRLFDEPKIEKNIPAERNADHRLVYLDYEGPVSGDRGSVKRWAVGRYEMIEEHRLELVMDVVADCLYGRFTLSKLPCTDYWSFRWSTPTVYGDNSNLLKRYRGIS
jgi:hypothetical protein